METMLRKRGALSAAAGVLALAGAAAGQQTWNASVLARARANDPPAPQHAPADVSANANYAPGANQRLWVPNPPGAEVNWDNDNYVLGGTLSWHTAVSGATQGQAKAKAGLGNNDSLVAVARARVRDILDGNLGNNGNDNTASSSSKASITPVYLLRVTGPGPTVQATLHTEACVAGQTTSPTTEPYHGVDSDPVLIPVGVVLRLGLTVEARAGYPFVLVVNPGSLVHYGLTVNENTVAEGQVLYEAGMPAPVPSGNSTNMVFTPWLGPGPMGEWWLDNGRGSYYGALTATLTLPAGYRFEYAECYPDCDLSTGPGVLDIFDFLCFQNRYAVQDPYACDCDTTTGVGVCDIFDFLCFQNAYAAGCQ